MIEWMTNDCEHNLNLLNYNCHGKPVHQNRMKWFQKATMTTKSVATRSSDHNRCVNKFDMINERLHGH